MNDAKVCKRNHGSSIVKQCLTHCCAQFLNLRILGIFSNVRKLSSVRLIYQSEFRKMVEFFVTKHSLSLPSASLWAVNGFSLLRTSSALS